MRALIIGRILGVGVRVLGRMAGQSVAGGATGQAVHRAPIRAVARSLGGIFAPIRRVGGIVWLEVMGVFFLLPALIAASSLWKARADWRSGPSSHTFWASVVVLVLFLYLSLSSFWRARRK